MKKVGILVGHHGAGTGTKYDDLDEWTLAKQDAERLQTRLQADGDFFPVLIAVDRDAHPWNVIDRTFGLNGGRNIRIRANWALEKQVDIAIELHYNSFTDSTVHGHEVLVPRQPSADARRLGRQINQGMTDAFTNRNRGTKESGVMILKTLGPKIPTVLVEPAFIFEPLVRSADWRDRYIEVLANGVRKYFKP